MSAQNVRDSPIAAADVVVVVVGSRNKRLVRFDSELAPAAQSARGCAK